MITSMREHRGYLYLGGIMNNRIGRYKLDGADPDFVQYDRRWGKSRMIAALQDLADRLLGRGDATITVPSFDGALKPNQILEKAETVAQFDAPEDLATDGKALFVADGSGVLRARRHRHRPRSARFDRADHRAVLPARRRHRGRARRARGAHRWRRRTAADRRHDDFRCPR